MGPLETWETKKCAFKDIDKASKNLKLFKADLLDYNSLHAAIEGCVGVFHVACPVPSEHIVCVELDTSMHLEEEACLETRVKRVVSVSSDGVVADGVVGWIKSTAEKQRTDIVLPKQQRKAMLWNMLRRLS
ncbi:hypothetical protein GIB67_035925 [Kingdonia uniflora]|uniref:3-beta hydroxysteroid dehydrogenase/isomerase domain-containing protein n=1 Tax=Kingdonia uniflora TaxID=39325 RepID=A0A7J7N104_9MAGN|nr:hypothetical protein GIB67_035925 [Kingdonia uniflora]